MSVDTTVAANVAGLLSRIKPAAYCDQCLARALALPLPTVTTAAEQLASTASAERKRGRCSPCRSTKRLVTRVMDRP